jgi:hypothetical protein
MPNMLEMVLSGYKIRIKGNTRGFVGFFGITQRLIYTESR